MSEVELETLVKRAEEIAGWAQVQNRVQGYERGVDDGTVELFASANDVSADAGEEDQCGS